MSESTRPVIVAGVDGSDHSIEALRHAKELADALGANVRVVGAWEWPFMWDPLVTPDYTPEEDITRVVHHAVESVFGAGHAIDVEIVHGPAAAALIAASHGAAMLVVGSRGHGGFAGLLLGSVSAECAEHAGCPVLVVHPSAA
ncbi:universal stress protein [Pseudolysinimonas sp.]|uniref:universal stress protein n=1 Tax=Pseudolysinimonas sp. TaxID=2680009 RepID=UPI003F7FF900